MHKSKLSSVLPLTADLNWPVKESSRTLMICVSESGKGSAGKVVLANCPTPLADERLVPLSELPLVSRMIVPPEESYEGNESSRSEDRIECDGQRRRWRRTRHNDTDINDKRNE
jgi:hypothetical protein